MPTQFFNMQQQGWLLLALINCIFLVNGDNTFLNFFNPSLSTAPHFTGSAFHNVSLNLDVEGSIAAYGDFNNDKYTDLFVLTHNSTVLQIYLWKPISWSFAALEQASVNISTIRPTPTNNNTTTTASYTISSVVPGDFNYDGKLDVLVMYSDTNDTLLTYMVLYFGHLTTLSASSFAPIVPSVGEVLVYDSDNNLVLDLFGQVPDPNNTSGWPMTRRAIWHNDGRGDFTVQLQSADLPMISTPHSNAFVDLNGDCLADLVVTSVSRVDNVTNQLEIWINGKTAGYSLYSVQVLPKGSGQLSFGDFDEDGTTDFIIPVCDPYPSCNISNEIIVVRNIQKPLCSRLSVTQASSKKNCRDASALCEADTNFRLGNISNSQSDPNVFVMRKSSFGASHFYFNPALGYPLTIRVDDTVPGQSSSHVVPRMELWANVVFNQQEDSSDSSSSDNEFSPATTQSKYFQRVDSDATTALSSINNAYAASFFDLDEDGVEDIFVLAQQPLRIIGLFNNIQNDAFFLKAVGLNGVCAEWCSTGDKFPNPKPYGVNFPGAVFKYTITDLDGQTRVSTATQLPQSAYRALGRPYVMFGLGRASNYIEQFFYGVPLNQTLHYNVWSGSTIPNSQVVAIPYKQTEPLSWTLELYTVPSGLVFWIMVAFLVSLVLLGVIITIFYRKEKKEDEKEKQDMAHLFSFDAL